MSGALEGKVALVTGAGSGIGAAIAERFRNEGARVYATDRAAGNGVLLLDVTSEEAWNAAAARVRREAGRLDVLVNNAGISLAAATAEMSFADWRRVMAVNLDGAFLGMRMALGFMLEQGEGCIINVASASGIRAVAGAAAYAASKAALRHLTKCVALECAQAGTRVRVCSLSPGGVKTPIWEDLPAFREVAEKDGREAAFAALAPGGPLQGFLEADAVAEAAVGLVRQPSLTACDVVMDGGWSA